MISKIIKQPYNNDEIMLVRYNAHVKKEFKEAIEESNKRLIELA